MRQVIIPTGVRAAVALALFLAAAYNVTGLEARRGKPAADVPVVLTFGTASTDALQSDGFVAPGYSADYAHGVENILAVLYPAGNLGFSTQADTRNNALRSVCINFGAQVVPFAALQCVNMSQPMHEYPSDITSIQNLAYGQSVAKLTRFAWTIRLPTLSTVWGTGPTWTRMDKWIRHPFGRPVLLLRTPPPARAQSGRSHQSPARSRRCLASRRQSEAGRSPWAQLYLDGITMPFVQTISRK